MRNEDFHCERVHVVRYHRYRDTIPFNLRLFEEEKGKEKERYREEEKKRNSVSISRRRKEYRYVV